MDKHPIVQIRNDSKSFEEALRFASRLMRVDQGHLDQAKSVDEEYARSSKFNVGQVYRIGLSIWLLNRFSDKSIKQFDKKYIKAFTDFDRDCINLYRNKVKKSQANLSDEIKSVRDKNLKIWCEFIASLTSIVGGESARKKVQLSSDAQLALVTFLKHSPC